VNTRVQSLSERIEQLASYKSDGLFMEPTAGDGKSEDILRNLSEAQNLALGTAVGVGVQTVLQPILYWKNATQQGLAFTLKPNIIYRGTLASCCNLGVLCGLQFLSAGVIQKAITGGVDRPMTTAEEISAGFFGGALSGPACCAMELIMIQQQRHGGTMLATPGRIVRNYGLKSILRGNVASTLRESVYTAGYLGIVPATQKFMKRNYGVPSYIGDIVGAAVGGFVCTFVSHPLDTVKTCMQGDVERKQHAGLVDTFKTLYRDRGGFRSLYRGFAWRYGNVFLDFMLFNALMRHIAPIVYPDLLVG